MTRSAFAFFACAVFTACAGPGIPAPETARQTASLPAAMPGEAAEETRTEALPADDASPVSVRLDLRDEIGMFHRTGSDDPLAVRLELPNGAAQIEFNALPSEDVASPHDSLARLCIANAPATVVGKTRRTVNDDWAEFAYEGHRDTDEVRGLCRVFRLEGNEDYTVRVHGEWTVGVHEMMLRRVEAITPTLRVSSGR